MQLQTVLFCLGPQYNYSATADSTVLPWGLISAVYMYIHVHVSETFTLSVSQEAHALVPRTACLDARQPHCNDVKGP